MRIKIKSEVVERVVLSAVLWLSVAAVAPSTPSSAPPPGAWNVAWNPWNSVAAAAVIAGGTAATVGGVLAAGQQAIVANPAAPGDERAVAVARLPVAVAVAVVGSAVVLSGVGVAVWQALTDQVTAEP